MRGSQSTISTRGGKARQSAVGQSTRTRLLDVAERMFVTSGIDGVSIRDVTRAANVNPAAIFHHFGSKDDFVRAVVGRRGLDVTTAMAQRLEAAQSNKKLSARELAETIVQAWVGLAESENGQSWLGCVDITIRNPQFRQLVLEGDNPWNREVVELFKLIGPQLPEEEWMYRAACITYLIHAALYTNGPFRHWLGEHAPRALEHDVDRLTEVVTAIIAAPNSQV